MTSTILVTGGTGRLGRRVVPRLLATGCQVRVSARHHHDIPSPATFHRADLRSGEGLAAAVQGVDVIVHCATSSKGDVTSARNLVAAAARAGSPLVVHVSIVGIEQIATWGYPKAKLETERVIAGSGLPWTILRATQFYDYILANAERLSRFPLVPVPAGFHVRPVDADDVAARLADLALGAPAGRTADLAGPDATDWVQLLRSYLRATDRRRWTVPVLIPGTRAVRRGALLPAPGFDVGTRTWEEFLAHRGRASTGQVPGERAG